MTGKELKAALDELGFGSQSRLAEALEAPIRTVQRWVSGESKISPVKAKAINAALKEISRLRKMNRRW